MSGLGGQGEIGGIAGSEGFGGTLARTGGREAGAGLGFRVRNRLAHRAGTDCLPWLLRLLVLALLLGLTVELLTPAQVYAATYANVQSVPNERLRDAGTYVSNPDAIINPTDVAEINRIASELQKSLGVEIAVVALSDIGDNDAREFATDLFNHWGVGQEGKDSGLLITEPPQRAVIFETGYGLEGVLPDAICYRLQQRYMLPDLKNGDYSAGMRKGVAAVRDYLMAGEPERGAMLDPAPDPEQEASPLTTVLGIIGLLVLFFVFRRNPAMLGFILGSIFGGRGGRGGGGGGSSGGGGSISRF